MPRRWCWLLFLIAPSLLAADIQTLSGKKVSGEPVGLDKQSLILRTPDGEIRHPIADVLAITLAAEPTVAGPFVAVELTDGTALHCVKATFRPKHLDVKLTTEQELSIPYTAIASICRDAHDARIRAEFQQFAARRGRFDQVAVRSEGRLNALDGTLGDGLPGGDGLEFSIAGSDQKSSPKLDRVAGFVFANRADPAAPPAICRVYDIGRNRLAAADVRWSDSGVTVKTSTGLTVAYPSAASLTRLDFSQGKLVWLSDLTPARAETRIGTEDGPSFGQFVRYRRDKNLENGPLRIDGTTFARGLGIHAGTVLVYELNGEYSQFRAMVGVDESVQTDSRVELVVDGDGRELFRGTVSRRDPLRPLTLDIRDVRQLTIEVRPVGLLELGAEVNLADAKVSK
jgi:hypothetical protein